MEEKTIQKIEAQQQGIEGTAPWMVGEQLKEICLREPESAELIGQDLENADMSLAAAEKKIKAYADSHKKGSFACVPPDVAEDILRKFYGLRERGGKTEPGIRMGESAPVLNLADFL